MKTINELKAMAADQVKQYPQYNGKFESWLPGIVCKDIRTKAGLAFKAHELVIVEPGVRRFTDLSKRKREMVTAWSYRNRIATSIDRKDIHMGGK